MKIPKSKRIARIEAWKKRQPPRYCQNCRQPLAWNESGHFATPWHGEPGFWACGEGK